MTDKSFSIRRAKEEDFQGLLKAHQKSIREIASRDHTELQVSSWSDFLTVDGYINAYLNGEEYFIAEIESTIVGFSSLKQNRVMAVYSAKSGLGLGEALYRTLENLARERGIEKLVLTSSLTARNFYKKLGFVELKESTHRFKAGASVRVFEMEKLLK